MTAACTYDAGPINTFGARYYSSQLSRFLTLSRSPFFAPPSSPHVVHLLLSASRPVEQELVCF